MVKLNLWVWFQHLERFNSTANLMVLWESNHVNAGLGSKWVTGLFLSPLWQRCWWLPDVWLVSLRVALISFIIYSRPPHTCKWRENREKWGHRKQQSFSLKLRLKGKKKIQADARDTLALWEKKSSNASIVLSVIGEFNYNPKTFMSPKMKFWERL